MYLHNHRFSESRLASLSLTQISTFHVSDEKPSHNKPSSLLSFSFCSFSNVLRSHSVLCVQNVLNNAQWCVFVCLCAQHLEGSALVHWADFTQFMLVTWPRFLFTFWAAGVKRLTLLMSVSFTNRLHSARNESFQAKRAFIWAFGNVCFFHDYKRAYRQTV